MQLIFSADKLNSLIDADPRTAADLAGLAGIQPSYLSQLRKGKRSNPRAAVLKNLAEVLNVPMEKFTGKAGSSEFLDQTTVLDQSADEELFLEGFDAMGRSWAVNKLADWFETGRRDQQFLQSRLKLIMLAVERLQETEPETEPAS